jgi:hypothetical protein
MHSAAEKGSAHAHSMLSYFYRGGAHGLPVDTRKSDFHNAAAEAIKKKDIGAV